jgi:hypothetical protein
MQFDACKLRFASFGSITRNLRSVTIFGLLLLHIFTLGCGKSSGKVSVHGHVSYRGEGLESAAVTFIPAYGRPEAASIKNGEYSTELMPGEYSAIVVIGVNPPKGYKEGDPIPPPKIALPEAYTSRDKSTLKATVKAGQSEPIDFELK